MFETLRDKLTDVKIPYKAILIGCAAAVGITAALRYVHGDYLSCGACTIESGCLGAAYADIWRRDRARKPASKKSADTIDSRVEFAEMGVLCSRG